MIRVVVVDDKKKLRDALRRRLERRNCRVQTALGSDVAFEMCEREPFDVVVTDIWVPGGMGIELLERPRLTLKDACPSIICMSAYSDLTM